MIAHPFMAEWEKRGLSIGIISFNPAASDEFRSTVLNSIPKQIDGRKTQVACLSAYDVWTVTRSPEKTES